MSDAMELAGPRIFLRLLTPADASEKYAAWMNDPEINRYLESRWSVHTMDSLRQFIAAMNDGSGRNYLFGIFLKGTGEHIGNIKIGNVHDKHRYADVGLLIGDRRMWGKGYGSESIGLVTRFAFEELKLNKLFAGMYAPNLGSYRAFINAGYREAGRLKRQYYCNGEYVDEMLVERVRGP